MIQVPGAVLVRFEACLATNRTMVSPTTCALHAIDVP
jgi:hypothetical protein